MVYLLTISRETLRHWREKGLPYNKKKKCYPLKNCLHWIRNNIWSPRDDYGDIRQEKLRRERAKRRQDECKAAEMEKKLIPVEQLEEILSILVVEFSQGIKGLAKRLSPALVLCKDQKEIEMLLRKEHNYYLEQMAKPLHAPKPTIKNRYSKQDQKQGAATG